MTAIWRLRAAALLLAGAFAVHQARYALLPPDHVHEGVHAYLAWVAPLIAIAALLAIGQFASRLALRRDEQAPPLPKAGTLTVCFLLVLMMLFGLQETTEAWLADGVLPSENVFLADGAWIATPIATILASVLALLLRGAQAVLQRVAGRQAHLVAFAPARIAKPKLPRPRPLTSATLARALAPRGPPLFS